MTITEALIIATRTLREANIGSGALDAELLLSVVLKKPREYLLAHGENALMPHDEKLFQELVKERTTWKPLAYLTGEKEFYGLRFLVNEHVLIPRPETELLIEQALPIIHFFIAHKKSFRVVDVGTGSGCIIVTLVKTLEQHKHEKSLGQYYALDLSYEALRVAQENAKRHEMLNRIIFLQGNLLEPFIEQEAASERKDETLVLANLPYLPSGTTRVSPLVHEPRVALDGGQDGLDIYRALLQQLELLSRPFTVLLECMPPQGATLKELVHYTFPKATITIKNDLSNLERLVQIRVEA